MDLGTIGVGVGSFLAGLFGGYKKKAAEAQRKVEETKKVIRVLDEAADAAMTSAVSLLAARAIAIAEMYGDRASTRLGPGTVIGDAEAKRAAAIEAAGVARQEAIDDFRRRMAAARAGAVPAVPTEERDTKPERAVRP